MYINWKLWRGNPENRYKLMNFAGRKLMEKVKNMLKFIDIGVNLTDPMFKGNYHGSSKHQEDLSDVLKRSWDNGVEKMIITGGSLEDSQKALDLAMTHESLYCTVGCHPTRCQEFEASENPDEYLQDLKQLAEKNRTKVVAFGECGLDYDRLQFCPKYLQLRYFEKQIELAGATKLPMFLHCRNAADDFIEIVKRNKESISGGVVHSFDGTKEEAQKLLDLGLYIGINGCSLKTAKNLEVMRTIPTEKLMIETDAPWCEIRPTHAGFNHIKSSFNSRKKEKWEVGCTVKGRNEPGMIVQVLEVLAGAREEDAETLAKTMYQNTKALFFPDTQVNKGS